MADQSVQTYIPSNDIEGQDAELKRVLLWDRKAKGGFPGRWYIEDLETPLSSFRDESIETAAERPHRPHKRSGALGQTWQEEGRENRG